MIAGVAASDAACFGSGVKSLVECLRCVDQAPISTVDTCIWLRSVNVTGSPSEAIAISEASIACYSERDEEFSEAPVILDGSLNISNSSYHWEGTYSA